MAARRSPTGPGAAALAAELTSTGPGRFHSLRGTSASPVLGPAHRIDDPAELLGVTAPADALGVAVVLGGTARSLGDAPAAPASLTDDGVTVAYLVLRSGEEFAALRPDRPGAPPIPVEPEDGFVRDVVRRALGLPTPPVAETVADLSLRLWVGAVLDAAADPARAHTVRTWRDVVALLPWLGDLAATGSDELLVPGVLAMALGEACATTSWEAMHLRACSGGADAPLIRWMDPPFFARWTLSGHRCVTDVLDDLRWFLDGPTLTSLQYTVDAVGWLGFAGSTDRPGSPRAT